MEVLEHQNAYIKMIREGIEFIDELIADIERKALNVQGMVTIFPGSFARVRSGFEFSKYLDAIFV